MTPEVHRAWDANRLKIIRLRVPIGRELENRGITTVPTITPVAAKLAPLPTKRRQKGRLGLGRVNAHHGQIKGLVNGRCHGVTTRHLGNYLGWNRAMLRQGCSGKALLDRALA